jgi:hypothetical protein
MRVLPSPNSVKASNACFLQMVGTVKWLYLSLAMVVIVEETDLKISLGKPKERSAYRVSDSSALSSSSHLNAMFDDSLNKW